MVGGSHPNAILAVHSQGDRAERGREHRSEATRSGEVVAPLDFKLTGGGEALHPAGGSVRGVDPAAAVDGDELGPREASTWVVPGAELPGTAPQPAPGPQEDSRGSELLDAGIPWIGDVQTAVLPE